MARINNGIINGFSGKIGNVVGCYRYGKYYLRTVPEKVKHPNTDKQLAQRMRFTLIQQFLQSISPFLRLGFGAYAAGRSAYNAAMSYNLENALKGSYPEITVDYPSVRISRGKLASPVSASLSFTDDKIIIINWENQTHISLGNANDSLLVVLICPSKNEAAWFTDLAKRSDCQVEVKVPVYFVGNELLCYITFTKSGIMLQLPSENSISDSFYCGSIVAN